MQPVRREDEDSEQISPRKPVENTEKAMDELIKSINIESRTTLIEPVSVSKTLKQETLTKSEIQIDFSINLKNSTTEKINFDKVEHKFDFDLGLDGPKDSESDHNKLIEEVYKELALV